MNTAARLDEIMRRAERIRRERERRTVAALSLGSTAAALTLVVLVGALSIRDGTAVRATTMGAFLLGPEAGSYALVGLGAFLLGILLASRAQKAKKAKEPAEKDSRPPSK